MLLASLLLQVDDAVSAEADQTVVNLSAAKMDEVSYFRDVFENTRNIHQKKSYALWLWLLLLVLLTPNGFWTPVTFGTRQDNLLGCSGFITVAML